MTELVILRQEDMVTGRAYWALAWKISGWADLI